MAKKKPHPEIFLRVAKILLVLLALPYAMTFVYRVVPPVSTPMLSDLLHFKRIHRDWEPLEQISPNLIAAVIASEDGAFCDHYGMDFRQMKRSVNEAISREQAPRATSTITMQTVKNLYLWNGRSYLRKILEAPLTFWTELLWPKRRILEVYLNVAEWGDGVYGAEAAARYHFGVSARELTPYQASLLAAALPNPIQRSAGMPGPAQQLIASTIQRRMRGADTRCAR